MSGVFGVDTILRRNKLVGPGVTDFRLVIGENVGTAIDFRADFRIATFGLNILDNILTIELVANKV